MYELVVHAGDGEKAKKMQLNQNVNIKKSNTRLN